MGVVPEATRCQHTLWDDDGRFAGAWIESLPRFVAQPGVIARSGQLRTAPDLGCNDSLLDNFIVGHAPLLHCIVILGEWIFPRSDTTGLTKLFVALRT